MPLSLHLQQKQLLSFTLYSNEKVVTPTSKRHLNFMMSGDPTECKSCLPYPDDQRVLYNHVSLNALKLQLSSFLGLSSDLTIVIIKSSLEVHAY